MIIKGNLILIIILEILNRPKKLIGHISLLIFKDRDDKSLGKKRNGHVLKRNKNIEKLFISIL